MFKIFKLKKKLKNLCFKLGWPIRRRSSKPKVVIRRFGKSNSTTKRDHSQKEALNSNGSAAIHPSSEFSCSNSGKKFIRVATFNAALFSMAPAVPNSHNKSGSFSFDFENEDLEMSRPVLDYDFRTKSLNNHRPRSILKQSPLHSSSMRFPDELSKQEKFARSKLRVSINLPDNEISLRRSGQLSFVQDEKQESSGRILKGKAPLRSNLTMPITRTAANGVVDGQSYGKTRTILEVLRELSADILALQHVKAEEEKGMKPLSDLAMALGMNYVFAESWAPEYGNAILSKWPIKKWKAQKIFDDSDFRFQHFSFFLNSKYAIFSGKIFSWKLVFFFFFFNLIKIPFLVEIIVWSISKLDNLADTELSE